MKGPRQKPRSASTTTLVKVCLLGAFVLLALLVLALMAVTPKAGSLKQRERSEHGGGEKAEDKNHHEDHPHHSQQLADEHHPTKPTGVDKKDGQAEQREKGHQGGGGGGGGGGHTNANGNILWRCATTKGSVTIRLRFDWAPLGARRMQELLELGFFTNMTFFRVPPLPSNPIAQFGISGIQKVRDESFKLPKLTDDPFPVGFQSEKDGPQWQKKGHFAFGGAGPNTRTFHMWVARDDFSNHAAMLGRNPWDMSVAETLSGLDVYSNLGLVGDMKPWGTGPDTSEIYKDPTFNDPDQFPGSYLTKNYPMVDWFKKCWALPSK